jgi:hypothetical protein
MDAINARIHAAELQQKADEKARDAAQKTYDEQRKNLEAQERLLDKQKESLEEQERLLDRQKNALEEQNRQLDKQRSDYDYYQKQKEDAAQKDLDATKALLEGQQALDAQVLLTAQHQIDAERAVMEAKSRADRDWIQGEQDKITAGQRAYDANKILLDSEMATRQGIIDKTKNQRDAELEQANAILQGWQDRATMLREAYGVVEKLDTAVDKGAKLTKDQAAALKDAKAAIDAIVPTLPQLHTQYDLVKTKFEAANKVIREDTVALWDINSTQENSIRKTYKTQHDKLDTDLGTKLDWTKDNVWGAHYNSLKTYTKTKLGDVGTANVDASKDLGGTLAKAMADGFWAQRDYVAQQMSATVQYGMGKAGSGGASSGTYPSNPTSPPPNQPGAGKGQSIDVNVNLNVNGAGMPKDQRVWDEVGSQILRSVKREQKMAGHE